MHHGYLYPHSAAAQTNYIRASDRVDTRKIKFRHRIVTSYNSNSNKDYHLASHENPRMLTRHHKGTRAMLKDRSMPRQVRISLLMTTSALEGMCATEGHLRVKKSYENTGNIQLQSIWKSLHRNETMNQLQSKK